MIKGGLLRKNWALALILTLIVGFANFTGLPALDRLERLAYDAGVRMTHRNPGSADRLAIIAMDHPGTVRSVQWPRSELADLLAWLNRAKPRAIGVTIALTDRRENPGLDALRKARNYVRKSRLRRLARKESAQLQKLLRRAERQMDVDGRLSQAITRARHVYLAVIPGVRTEATPSAGKPPGYVTRHRLKRVDAGQIEMTGRLIEEELHYPLEEFGRYSAGVGILRANLDPDGGIRSDQLIYRYRDDDYPSFSLMLAARGLGLGVSDITVDQDGHIHLDHLLLQTDKSGRMYSGFYPPANGNESAFPVYPYADIRAGKIQSGSFTDKIVLVGLIAPDAGNVHPTPVAPAMPMTELSAHIIASILNQDYYFEPEWSRLLEAALFLAIFLYLITVVPRVVPGIAASMTLLLVLALLVGGHYLMISEKIWIKSVAPALLLLTGHVLLATKRHFMGVRRKIRDESDTAQTNRMLGLAFQGQGQLDMAMDKFRKLTVDESVLELIYNLALDFERKRQFNKAVAAYDYISQHESSFRDVTERRKRAAHTEGMMIKGTHALGNGTLVLDGMHQKPTLGRYQIEKELGKGAMGTVYLGRDPRINRIVAIKTLALSQEFEQNDLRQVKERFFLEAETAGRLNHPNIVTIYDVGEDQDLAYIAMEYLEGKDLSHYINADPPPDPLWILNVMRQVADALDYAHARQVVHRDIKPANIMYLESSNSIKITDFGIARITASNRTRTGVVLGTPSYMSPEQLAGKRVDGRSDLFSLGVTLYELLTGQQPFTGDSMATLVYQIANKRHADISRHRGEIPACLRNLTNKLLQKDPGKRVQTGAELKKAIIRCMEKVKKSGPHP